MSASNDEYQQQRSFDKGVFINGERFKTGNKLPVYEIVCNDSNDAGIKSLSIISDPLPGFEFHKVIAMTIPAPTKPYWEIFGHKTQADYHAGDHLIIRDKNDCYYCYTCKCESKNCKLSKGTAK